MKKTNATNNAKTKNNAIERHVPPYTPSFEKYNKLMNQISEKTPTNLHYQERSVFMKEVNTKNFWTVEFGTQKGITVPIWVFVIFRQSDREHNQNLNNDTFFRTSVTSVQCIFGTEKHPDNAILLNYNDDENSQWYGQIKKGFGALTRDNIL